MDKTASVATVDASVWVAAADSTDAFSEASRAFLAESARRGVQLIIPAFAIVEVACALARKHQDATVARQLVGMMLAPDQVRHVPVDRQLLAASMLLGTNAFLRGADALYAATAYLTGSTLVSWDNELVQRAGASTPTAWLAVEH
jgi:predicted nucleic acid-binding protein